MRFGEFSPQRDHFRPTCHQSSQQLHAKKPALTADFRRWIIEERDTSGGLMAEREAAELLFTPVHDVLIITNMWLEHQ